MKTAQEMKAIAVRAHSKTLEKIEQQIELAAREGCTFIRAEVPDPIIIETLEDLGYRIMKSRNGKKIAILWGSSV